MPATSLSSLIIDLVASMESSAAILCAHHRSDHAVRRLVREAQSLEVDAGAGAGVGVGASVGAGVEVGVRAPGAAALAGAGLRQERPEQAGGNECGVAIDHPVADCACAVR